MKNRDKKRKKRVGCLSKVIATIGLCIFLVNQIKWPNFKLPYLPWFWGNEEIDENKNSEGETIENLFSDLEIPKTNIKEKALNIVVNNYEELKENKPKERISYDIDLFSDTYSKVPSFSVNQAETIIDQAAEEIIALSKDREFPVKYDTVINTKKAYLQMLSDTFTNMFKPILDTNNIITYEDKRILPDNEEVLLKPFIIDDNDNTLRR